MNEYNVHWLHLERGKVTDKRGADSLFVRFSTDIIGFMQCTMV